MEGVQKCLGWWLLHKTSELVVIKRVKMVAIVLLKANICLLWMKAAATLSSVQVHHVEIHLIWMGSKWLRPYTAWIWKTCLLSHSPCYGLQFLDICTCGCFHLCTCTAVYVLVVNYSWGIPLIDWYFSSLWNGCHEKYLCKSYIFSIV